MVVSVPMPSYPLDFCIFTQQIHFCKFALMSECVKLFVSLFTALEGQGTNEDGKPET